MGKVPSDISPTHVHSSQEALGKRTPPPASSETPAAKPVKRSKLASKVSLISKYPVRDLKSLKARKEAGSAINTGAVSSKVRQRVEGIRSDALKDAGTRFQEDNFGSVVSSGGTSRFGEIAGFASNRSRNPLDTMPAMVGSRNSQVSEDPAAEEPSTWESFKNWAGNVVESILGGVTSKSPAGNAAGAGPGAVASGAWNVLTANTGSPEEKKNEFNGFIGLWRQHKKGTSHEDAADMLELTGDNLEPVQDDMGGGGTSRPTPALINRFKGGKAPYIEPANDDGSGSGGKVNTGANGTGKRASQSTPLAGDIDRAMATRFDAIAMEVRITKDILIVQD